MIFTKDFLDEKQIFDFLKSRVGLLDGVVLSGGECSIWGNKLIALIEQVKSMGFCIKIDTNGSNPKVLEELLSKNLLDYVSLDFKALEDRFQEICGKNYFKEFEESFALLRDSALSYEVRTTFHSDLLTPSEIEKMRDWLRERGYEGKYYVQGFVGDKGSLGNLKASNHNVLKNIKGIVLRGVQ